MNKIKIFTGVFLLSIASFSLINCSSEDNVVEESIIEKIDAKKLTSTLKESVTKFKETRNLNSSLQLRSSGLTETEAQNFIQPLINDTRNLLLQEGISESEIINEFGSLNAPELALVGISIIEIGDDEPIYSETSGHVLDCAARAFVGFELHEGFWSQFSNRRMLLRAIGKIATRYLGAIGAALIVYDFADCMWG